jgi:uncharacterized protein
MEDEAVLVAVAAAPVGGKATQEARRLLARGLDLPPTAVTLHAGARSRRKVFLVRGLTPEEVTRRLNRAADQG